MGAAVHVMESERRSLEIRMTLDQILDCLERRRIRATYAAVGAVIGKPARSVGAALGRRTRRASWVVSARDGQPTGYRSHQKHPDLHRTRHVIRTGDELRRMCATSRIVSDKGSSVLPRLVTHADWSKNPKKRWCATAALGTDGRYRVGTLEAGRGSIHIFHTPAHMRGCGRCGAQRFRFPDRTAEILRRQGRQ